MFLPKFSFAMENNFDRKAIFAAAHTSFYNGMRNFKATEPRDWLATLRLTHEKAGTVFNSGQYIHRKSEEILAGLLHIGFIQQSDAAPNREKSAYSQFGIYSVMFPLRDRDGDVVNYFAVQFAHQNTPCSFLNADGLYPGVPPTDCKTLFVCADTLGAASILESGVLDNKESVVALFEGEVKPQHLEILSEKSLREAVLIGCTDAVVGFIRERFPHLPVRSVVLPEGESVNSLWVAGGRERLSVLLATRQGTSDTTDDGMETGGLLRVNAHKMIFRGEVADYFILGNIGMEPSALTLTLKIQYKAGQVSVHQIDLFSAKDRGLIAKEAQLYEVNPNELEMDLMLLLNLVEMERDRQLDSAVSTKHKRMEPELTHARHVELLGVLSAPDLMQTIDTKLSEAGIVGETGTRLTVFVIAASYQHPNPLHIILQGSSGSGKTHLLNTVAACIPEDRILSLTKLSSMSLYYLDSEEITDRLLVVQDLDGLNEESLYALRELQSAKSISNFRPYRDRKNGDIKTEAKEVRGSFASLMATTHSEIYYDNFSRSVILGVSEDAAQTRAIVEYQNKKRAGIIDADAERDARELLRDMHHLLKPSTVVNPYAHRLSIPVDGMMLRRLNEQFLSFTEMLTILHQYQRQKDTQGRLITTKEDLRHAAELFFTAIFLKVDDMDSGLRQFFEQLKQYVRQHCPANKFCMRDVRHALKYSKSHTHRFFNGLKQREYIRVVGGTANKGFTYEIDLFDDAEKMKEKIKNELLRQIEELD